MVIFGLLLGLGMLIDGAIVMVEYADRKMAEGLDSREAYKAAVHRMFWPITASTATTLAAFLPLMFWPGVSGQFMSYLPITVFAVLIGSMFYALLFAPTIGALIGKSSDADKIYLRSLEEGDPAKTNGVTGIYAAVLKRAVRAPGIVLIFSITTLISIIMAYDRWGSGIEFFVSAEPLQTQVQIFARGNYSPAELRTIMLDAEDRIAEIGYYEGIVTQSGAGVQSAGPAQAAPDLIGTIFIELTDRRTRDLNGFEIESMYREAISEIPGVRAEIVTIEQGPPVGKEIQVELAGENLDLLFLEAERIRAFMETEMTGLIDIDDTAPNSWNRMANQCGSRPGRHVWGQYDRNWRSYSITHQWYFHGRLST